MCNAEDQASCNPDTQVKRDPQDERDQHEYEARLKCARDEKAQNAQRIRKLRKRAIRAQRKRLARDRHDLRVQEQQTDRQICGQYQRTDPEGSGGDQQEVQVQEHSEQDDEEDRLEESEWQKHHERCQWDIRMRKERVRKFVHREHAVRLQRRRWHWQRLKRTLKERHRRRDLRHQMKLFRGK